MSFEGYYQVLCRNGHENGAACGFGDDPCFTPQEHEQNKKNDEFGMFSRKLWKCRCGEVAGWWNLVDDTNGDQAGRISLTEVSPDEYQMCNMNHRHRVKEATCKPAEKGGHFVNGGLK